MIEGRQRNKRKRQKLTPPDQVFSLCLSWHSQRRLENLPPNVLSAKVLGTYVLGPNVLGSELLGTNVSVSIVVLGTNVLVSIVVLSSAGTHGPGRTPSAMLVRVVDYADLKTPNGPSRSCAGTDRDTHQPDRTLSTTMVPPVLDPPDSSNVPSSRLSPTLGSALAEDVPSSRLSPTLGSALARSPTHVRLPTAPFSPRQDARNFHPTFASPTQFSRLWACAPRRRLLDVSLVPVQEPRERSR